MVQIDVIQTGMFQHLKLTDFARIDFDMPKPEARDQECAALPGNLDPDDFEKGKKNPNIIVWKYFWISKCSFL